MSDYVYQRYPRRLYLHGEVIVGDLHATNSVVVESEHEEAVARAKGYRVAYESNGGNGGSQPVPSTPELSVPPFTQDQDAAAGVSADPIAEDVDEIGQLRAELEALGGKADRRWKEERLKAEIKAQKKGSK